jgi:hypothetical protein
VVGAGPVRGWFDRGRVFTTRGDDVPDVKVCRRCGFASVGEPMAEVAVTSSQAWGIGVHVVALCPECVEALELCLAGLPVDHEEIGGAIADTAVAAANLS